MMDDLILDNLALVGEIAGKYVMYTKHMDYDDLFQEGCIGLMNAAKRYNPGRGVKFSTYAYEVINGTILRAIDIQDNIIRKPVSQKENKVVYSLDAKMEDSEDSDDMYYINASNAQVEELVIEKVYREQTIKKVHDTIAKLPKKRRDVLIHYFGIGCEPKTLNEVAKTLGYKSKQSVHYNLEKAKESFKELYVEE